MRDVYKRQVLTISAAGSETSDSAVLTNDETTLKRGLNTDLQRPLFAIMDPELTYTLPRYQVGCGVVDIMMHTLERYFNPGHPSKMCIRDSRWRRRAAWTSSRWTRQAPSLRASRRSPSFFPQPV